MSKNASYVALAIVFIAVIAALAALLIPTKSAGGYTSDSLQTFAQCLADKKITMYGAAWCSHCQAQKKLFGESFKLVPYVECPDNVQMCLDKGVRGYPTWILPDGSKLEGEQTFETLAQKASCPVPVKAK